MAGQEHTSGGLSAQRELWADAHWRRWVLAVTFTRLCGTMMPFALLLAGEAALGSFSAGAWMTSAYSMGGALHRLASAFAIDAVLIEVTWIGGPPLVGVLALFHPSLALGLLGVSAGAAILANRLLPSREPPPASPSRGGGLSLGPLLQGLPLLVYVTVVATGVSWGTMDTALPPMLVQLGSRAEVWGALAALMSVTSALGGLLSAGAPRPGSTAAAVWRSLLFLGLWSVLLLPLGVTRGLTSTAVWLAAAGLFLAPLVGLLTYLLQQALPADRQAEGFSVYGACWSLGIGVGSALTAVLLEHAGARVALVLSGVVPLVLVLAVAPWVRSLVRASSPAAAPLTAVAQPGAGDGAGAP